MLAVGLRIGRQVLASGSPWRPAALFIGLGSRVAVIYGIARDSSIGLLVWMPAMAFGRLVGGRGLLAVDRVAFLALVGDLLHRDRHRAPRSSAASASPSS